MSYCDFCHREFRRAVLFLDADNDVDAALQVKLTTWICASASEALRSKVSLRDSPAAPRENLLLLLPFLRTAAGLPQLLTGLFPTVRRVLSLGAQIMNVLRILQVGEVSAALIHHLRQFALVIQKRTWAQHVVVERLVVMVGHEQRALIRLQQCLLTDVGIAVMDEGAGLDIAAGVDVQVAPSARDAAVDNEILKQAGTDAVVDVRVDAFDEPVPVAAGISDDPLDHADLAGHATALIVLQQPVAHLDAIIIATSTICWTPGWRHRRMSF